jgi:hypothetical protein
MSLLHLTTLRSSGLRPSGNVWVTLTTTRKKQDFDDWVSILPLKVQITPLDWDFRVFTGLNVALFMEGKWTSEVARVVDGITKFADWVTVLNPAWGDDIGFHIHQSNKIPI